MDLLRDCFHSQAYNTYYSIQKDIKQVKAAVWPEKTSLAVTQLGLVRLLPDLTSLEAERDLIHKRHHNRLPLQANDIKATVEHSPWETQIHWD